jgi:hypothetical protein
MREGRRDERVRVDVPAACVADAADRHVLGRVTDLSIGGARIEAEVPAAFGPTVTLYLRLPGGAQTLALPAIVRWVRGGAMGLQFGSIGVREVHLLVRLASAASQVLDEADVAWIG